MLGRQVVLEPRRSGTRSGTRQRRRSPAQERWCACAMDFASPFVFAPAAAQEQDEQVAAGAATAVVEIDEEDLSHGLDAYSIADESMQAVEAPGQCRSPRPAADGAAHQGGSGGFLSQLFGKCGSAPPDSAPPEAVPPAATQGEEGSDELMSRAASLQQLKQANRSRRSRSSGRVFRRETDVNVISLKLGTLGEIVDVATGEPCACTECGAMFSSISKLQTSSADHGASPPNLQGGVSAPPILEEPPQDIDDGRWRCEFCGAENVPDLEPEEIPTTDTVDYLIESAPVVRAADPGEELVVFCIDTSGS
eukprot:COSAG02_NODE_12677_length_1510_cov_4.098819_1_plen_307_part_10